MHKHLQALQVGPSHQSPVLPKATASGSPERVIPHVIILAALLTNLSDGATYHSDRRAAALTEYLHPYYASINGRSHFHIRARHSDRRRTHSDRNRSAYSSTTGTYMANPARDAEFDALQLRPQMPDPFMCPPTNRQQALRAK
ncbi:hypothetical protein MHU86_21323 [Fragilaria crotonensis]|nr:hypothetical protein MHU86_21323 [Fragilaria crotonensis]